MEKSKNPKKSQENPNGKDDTADCLDIPPNSRERILRAKLWCFDRARANEGQKAEPNPVGSRSWELMSVQRDSLRGGEKIQDGDLSRLRKHRIPGWGISCVEPGWRKAIGWMGVTWDLIAARSQQRGSQRVCWGSAFGMCALRHSRVQEGVESPVASLLNYLSLSLSRGSQMSGFLGHWYAWGTSNILQSQAAIVSHPGWSKMSLTTTLS